MGGWRPRDLGAGGEDQLLFLATPSLSWLLQKRSRVWGGGRLFLLSFLCNFFAAQFLSWDRPRWSKWKACSAPPMDSLYITMIYICSLHVINE